MMEFSAIEERKRAAPRWIIHRMKQAPGRFIGILRWCWKMDDSRPSGIIQNHPESSGIIRKWFKSIQISSWLFPCDGSDANDSGHPVQQSEASEAEAFRMEILLLPQLGNIWNPIQTWNQSFKYSLEINPEFINQIGSPLPLSSARMDAAGQ